MIAEAWQEFEIPKVAKSNKNPKRDKSLKGWSPWAM